MQRAAQAARDLQDVQNALRVADAQQLRRRLVPELEARDRGRGRGDHHERLVAAVQEVPHLDAAVLRVNGGIPRG